MKLLPLHAGPNRDGGTGHHGGFCAPYSWDRPQRQYRDDDDCPTCGGRGMVAPDRRCPTCIGGYRAERDEDENLSWFGVDR